MLLVCISIYLQSVLRYKFLILDASHLDTQYLREQGFEASWLFCEAKKGPRAKGLGNTDVHFNSSVQVVACTLSSENGKHFLGVGCGYRMIVPRNLTVATGIQGWFKAVAPLVAGMEPRRGGRTLLFQIFCQAYFVYLLYILLHCQFRTTRRKGAQIYISIRPRSILNMSC
jgi:hypothetical protein